jgi:hypothetical protein
MMGLTTLIAAAIESGDMTQHEGGAVVDLFGGMGRATKLGCALIRVVGSHDLGSLRDARALLADELSDRYGAQMTYGLCLATSLRALLEWAAIPCSSCNSSGRIKSEKGGRTLCPDCKGSGRGESSVDDRMDALKLHRDAVERLNPVFKVAREILIRAHEQAEGEVAMQIGLPYTARTYRSA